MIRRIPLLLAVFAVTVACADPPAARVPPAPPTRPTSTVADEPTPTSELVPVHPNDPSLGPKTAPITVVVFSDFQCPFCKRVEPTLAALREQYGARLRVVWKDLPLDFHKHAREAAVVARVAYLARGNDAFWAMHARIFENQTQLSPENLYARAAELGVDASTIAARREEAEELIDRSLAEAKQLAVRGTPNFLINGQLLTGAQPREKFEAIFDAQLARARELVTAGTQPSELYPALVKTFWKAPVAEEPVEETLDPTVWNAAVGNAPVHGPKDALVTIVTFSDFQCPFCKRIEPTFAQLEKDYAGKIRFVWKNQPLSFHPRAMPAAIAAHEVRKQKGDDAFWKYHDLLFASQPRLEDDDLVDAATQIPGVDGKKVRAAIEKEKWRSEIENDMEQAEHLKVSGTPASFVNGRPLVGAQPLDKWKRLIDEELSKAEAKVKAGTAPEKLYEEIIKNGKTLGPVDLKIPTDAPWKGGANAKVILHVFSDYQCPFCRRLERSIPDATGDTGTLEKIAQRYGDKIKIVWRDFPLSFHPRARAAAAFAREAKKQKGMATFWKIHDELFDLGGKLEDENLADLAKRYGIDWTKAKNAIDAGTWDDVINADQEAGSAASVTGTPVVFVNGKMISGAQPEEAFVKAIDKALAKK